MRNYFLLLMIIAAELCFAGNVKVVGTRTLAQETANNTSAYDGWDGNDRTTVGTGLWGVPVAGPGGASAAGSEIGYISKVDLLTLLSSKLQSTKIGVHIQGWFTICGGGVMDGSCGGHTEVGYASSDPVHITRLVDDLISRGYHAVNIDWYGPGSKENTNGLLLLSELNSRCSGGVCPVELSVAVDGGALDNCVSLLPASSASCHCPNGAGTCVGHAGESVDCSAQPTHTSTATNLNAYDASSGGGGTGDREVCWLTNEMMYQLRYLKNNYFGSQVYLDRKARASDSLTRPVVTFFSPDSIPDGGTTNCDTAGTPQGCTVTSDYDAIATQRNTTLFGDPIFLFRKRDGLSHAQNNGGFGWSGCGGDGTVTNGAANGTTPGCSQENAFLDVNAPPATYQTPPGSGGAACSSGCVTKNLNDPYGLAHWDDTNSASNGFSSPTHTSSLSQYSSQVATDKPSMPGVWVGENNRWAPWGGTQRKLVFRDDGQALIATYRRVNQYYGAYSGTVNTSSTNVSWTGGDHFIDWPGSKIVINSVTYTISSVASANSLTLTASAGTQTGVAYAVNNPQAKDLLTQTWDDYDEGTAHEMGLTSGLSITSPTLAGSTFSWTTNGNWSTSWFDFSTIRAVHHFQILISSDGGATVMTLADNLSATLANVDLSSYGLEPGTYKVYAKAVAQPMLVNALSAAVDYTQLAARPNPHRRTR